MAVDLFEAISELDVRIRQHYNGGDPYQFSLSGHKPDFEVDSVDPLNILEYVSGSPSLVGRFPVRSMVIVEAEVVSIFDGRGYYASRTFGVRNTVSGLNNMFTKMDLPYRIN